MLYELIIHNLTEDQAKIIMKGLSNKEKYLPEIKPQVIKTSD